MIKQEYYVMLFLTPYPLPGSTIPPITPDESSQRPATEPQDTAAVPNTEAPDEGVFLTQVILKYYRILVSDRRLRSKITN